MPDHVHLLLGAADSSFLPNFIKDFKQRTGYAFRQSYGKPLWQKSYHDHILRAEEDCEAVASYILANPVRAGLVERPTDYTFSGPFRERMEA